MTAFSTFEYQPKLWKLKRPLKTSHGEIAMRSSIMLRVNVPGREDVVGLGEASPLPGWSKESYEEVLEQVAELPEVLPRFSSTTPEALDAWLDEQGVSSTSLRFGLGAALIDLEAQLRGESWGAVLGHGIHSEISVALLCSDIETARTEYSAGVRTFKIKAGMNLGLETELLKALLGLGEDIRIRIDVNEGWSLEEALSAWDTWRFAWPSIDFIEEPLKPDSKSGWEVLGQAGVPLAFDESVRNRDDLEALIRRGLSGVVVLKPSLIGTPNEVLSLIKVATGSHLKVMVSNLIETSVTRLYCAYLASFISPSLAAGLGTGGLFQEDCGALPLEPGAVIRLPKFRTSQECVR